MSRDYQSPRDKSISIESIATLASGDDETFDGIRCEKIGLSSDMIFNPEATTEKTTNETATAAQTMIVGESETKTVILKDEDCYVAQDETDDVVRDFDKAGQAVDDADDADNSDIIANNNDRDAKKVNRAADFSVDADTSSNDACNADTRCQLDQANSPVDDHDNSVNDAADVRLFDNIQVNGQTKPPNVYDAIHQIAYAGRDHTVNDARKENAVGNLRKAVGDANLISIDKPIDEVNRSNHKADANDPTDGPDDDYEDVIVVDESSSSAPFLVDQDEASSPSTISVDACETYVDEGDGIFDRLSPPIASSRIGEDDCDEKIREKMSPEKVNGGETTPEESATLESRGEVLTLAEAALTYSRVKNRNKMASGTEINSSSRNVTLTNDTGTETMLNDNGETILRNTMEKEVPFVPFVAETTTMTLTLRGTTATTLAVESDDDEAAALTVASLARSEANDESAPSLGADPAAVCALKNPSPTEAQMSPHPAPDCILTAAMVAADIGCDFESTPTSPIPEDPGAALCGVAVPDAPVASPSLESTSFGRVDRVIANPAPTTTSSISSLTPLSSTPSSNVFRVVRTDQGFLRVVSPANAGNLSLDGGVLMGARYRILVPSTIDSGEQTQISNVTMPTQSQSTRPSSRQPRRLQPPSAGTKGNSLGTKKSAPKSFNNSASSSSPSARSKREATPESTKVDSSSKVGTTENLIKDKTKRNLERDRVANWMLIDHEYSIRPHFADKSGTTLPDDRSDSQEPSEPLSMTSFSSATPATENLEDQLARIAREAESQQIPESSQYPITERHEPTPPQQQRPQDTPPQNPVASAASVPGVELAPMPESRKELPLLKGKKMIDRDKLPSWTLIDHEYSVRPDFEGDCIVYFRDEEKQGCARTRGVADECPSQIGEKIKIKGKKRLNVYASRGRPRKSAQLFGDDESDDDADAVDGTPDVEDEDEADEEKEKREGEEMPVGVKKEREERSAREYDKFTTWFTKFAEKNGAKRRRAQVPDGSRLETLNKDVEFLTRGRSRTAPRMNNLNPILSRRLAGSVTKDDRVDAPTKQYKKPQSPAHDSSRPAMTVMDLSDIKPISSEDPNESANKRTPPRSGTASFLSPSSMEKTPDDPTSDLSSLLPLPQGGLSDIENMFINSVLENIGGGETDNETMSPVKPVKGLATVTGATTPPVSVNECDSHCAVTSVETSAAENVVVEKLPKEAQIESFAGNRDAPSRSTSQDPLHDPLKLAADSDFKSGAEHQSAPFKDVGNFGENVSGNREAIEAAMRILSEAMLNDPMMTQNLSELLTEENFAEFSAMANPNDIYQETHPPVGANFEDPSTRATDTTAIPPEAKTESATAPATSSVASKFGGLFAASPQKFKDGLTRLLESPLKKDDRRKDLFSLNIDDSGGTIDAVGGTATLASSSGLELFPEAVLNEDLPSFNVNSPVRPGASSVTSTPIHPLSAASLVPGLPPALASTASLASAPFPPAHWSSQLQQITPPPQKLPSPPNPQPLASTPLPPTLTTVNVFYNDLPAIVLDGVPMIRLADIHHQVLRDKNTSALRRKVQSMGLKFSEISERQRDLLIRYDPFSDQRSNSCVVVTPDVAHSVIDSYVNPKKYRATLANAGYATPRAIGSAPRNVDGATPRLGDGAVPEAARLSSRLEYLEADDAYGGFSPVTHFKPKKKSNKKKKKKSSKSRIEAPRRRDAFYRSLPISTTPRTSSGAAPVSSQNEHHSSAQNWGDAADEPLASDEKPSPNDFQARNEELRLKRLKMASEASRNQSPAARALTFEGEANSTPSTPFDVSLPSRPPDVGGLSTRVARISGTSGSEVTPANDSKSLADLMARAEHAALGQRQNRGLLMRKILREQRKKRKKKADKKNKTKRQDEKSDSVNNEYDDDASEAESVTSKISSLSNRSSSSSVHRRRRRGLTDRDATPEAVLAPPLPHSTTSFPISSPVPASASHPVTDSTPEGLPVPVPDSLPAIPKSNVKPTTFSDDHKLQVTPHVRLECISGEVEAFYRRSKRPVKQKAHDDDEGYAVMGIRKSTSTEATPTSKAAETKTKDTLTSPKTSAIATMTMSPKEIEDPPSILKKETKLQRSQSAARSPSSAPRPTLSCFDCSASFCRPSEVVLHQMSTHSTFRPFVCLFCGKSASKRDRVRKHLRLHHDFDEEESGKGYSVENLMQLKRKLKELGGAESEANRKLKFGDESAPRAVTPESTATPLTSPGSESTLHASEDEPPSPTRTVASSSRRKKQKIQVMYQCRICKKLTQGRSACTKHCLFKHGIPKKAVDCYIGVKQVKVTYEPVPSYKRLNREREERSSVASSKSSASSKSPASSKYASPKSTAAASSSYSTAKSLTSRPTWKVFPPEPSIDAPKVTANVERMPLECEVKTEVKTEPMSPSQTTIEEPQEIRSVPETASTGPEAVAGEMSANSFNHYDAEKTTKEAMEEGDGVLDDGGSDLSLTRSVTPSLVESTTSTNKKLAETMAKVGANPLSPIRISRRRSSVADYPEKTASLGPTLISPTPKPSKYKGWVYVTEWVPAAQLVEEEERKGKRDRGKRGKEANVNKKSDERLGQGTASEEAYRGLEIDERPELNSKLETNEEEVEELVREAILEVDKRSSEEPVSELQGVVAGDEEEEEPPGVSLKAILSDVGEVSGGKTDRESFRVSGKKGLRHDDSFLLVKVDVNSRVYIADSDIDENLSPSEGDQGKRLKARFSSNDKKDLTVDNSTKVNASSIALNEINDQLKEQREKEDSSVAATIAEKDKNSINRITSIDPDILQENLKLSFGEKHRSQRKGAKSVEMQRISADEENKEGDDGILSQTTIADAIYRSKEAGFNSFAAAPSPISEAVASPTPSVASPSLSLSETERGRPMSTPSSRRSSRANTPSSSRHRRRQRGGVVSAANSRSATPESRRHRATLPDQSAFLPLSALPRPLFDPRPAVSKFPGSSLHHRRHRPSAVLSAEQLMRVNAMRAPLPTPLDARASRRAATVGASSPIARANESAAMDTADERDDVESNEARASSKEGERRDSGPVSSLSSSLRRRLARPPDRKAGAKTSRARGEESEVVERRRREESRERNESGQTGQKRVDGEGHAPKGAEGGGGGNTKKNEEEEEEQDEEEERVESRRKGAKRRREESDQSETEETGGESIRDQDDLKDDVEPETTTTTTTRADGEGKRERASRSKKGFVDADDDDNDDDRNSSLRVSVARRRKRRRLDASSLPSASENDDRDSSRERKIPRRKTGFRHSNSVDDEVEDASTLHHHIAPVEAKDCDSDACRRSQDEDDDLDVEEDVKLSGSELNLNSLHQRQQQRSSQPATEVKSEKAYRTENIVSADRKKSISSRDKVEDKNEESRDKVQRPRLSIDAASESSSSLEYSSSSPPRRPATRTTPSFPPPPHRGAAGVVTRRSLSSSSSSVPRRRGFAAAAAADMRAYSDERRSRRPRKSSSGSSSIAKPTWMTTMTSDDEHEDDKLVVGSVASSSSSSSFRPKAFDTESEMAEEASRAESETMPDTKSCTNVKAVAETENREGDDATTPEPTTSNSAPLPSLVSTPQSPLAADPPPPSPPTTMGISPPGIQVKKPAVGSIGGGATKKKLSLSDVVASLSVKAASATKEVSEAVSPNSETEPPRRRTMECGRRRFFKPPAAAAAAETDKRLSPPITDVLSSLPPRPPAHLLSVPPLLLNANSSDPPSASYPTSLSALHASLPAASPPPLSTSPSPAKRARGFAPLDELRIRHRANPKTQIAAEPYAPPQIGVLSISLLKMSSQAACVTCAACRKLFTVTGFVGHAHHRLHMSDDPPPPVDLNTRLLEFHPPPEAVGHPTSKAAATLIADIWSSILRKHNRKIEVVTATTTTPPSKAAPTSAASFGESVAAADEAEIRDDSDARVKENVGIQACFPNMEFEDSSSDSDSETRRDAVFSPTQQHQELQQPQMQLRMQQRLLSVAASRQLQHNHNIEVIKISERYEEGEDDLDEDLDDEEVDVYQSERRRRMMPENEKNRPLSEVSDLDIIRVDALGKEDDSHAQWSDDEELLSPSSSSSAPFSYWGDDAGGRGVFSVQPSTPEQPSRLANATPARRTNCGVCQGCKVPNNCGTCAPCRNKNLKKKCVQRRCLALLTDPRGRAIHVEDSPSSDIKILEIQLVLPEDGDPDTAPTAADFTPASRATISPNATLADSSPRYYPPMQQQQQQQQKQQPQTQFSQRATPVVAQRYVTGVAVATAPKKLRRVLNCGNCAPCLTLENCGKCATCMTPEWKQKCERRRCVLLPPRDWGQKSIDKRRKWEEEEDEERKKEEEVTVKEEEWVEESRKRKRELSSPEREGRPVKIRVRKVEDEKEVLEGQEELEKDKSEEKSEATSTEEEVDDYRRPNQTEKQRPGLLTRSQKVDIQVVELSKLHDLRRSEMMQSAWRKLRRRTNDDDDGFGVVIRRMTEASGGVS